MVDDPQSAPATEPQPVTPPEGAGPAKNISDASASFTDQFHEVMRHIEQLKLRDAKLKILMGMMNKTRERFHEILRKSGKPEEEVAGIKAENLLFDGGILLKTKFAESRNYIRTSKQRLQQISETTDPQTDFEMRKMIVSVLQENPYGAYILQHFSDELHALLDAPYNETAQKNFEEKVIAKYKADGNIPPADKDVADVAFMSLMHSLKDVENLKGNSHLSAASIDGMLGSVLEEESMQKLFDGQLEIVQNLPAASIRLVVADQTFDFYHAEKQPIPADILKVINGKPRLPIVHVHYRTDADVAILIADMSKEEFLRGKTCKGGECILLEGQTKSPDFDVLQAPAGFNKEAFLKQPMKDLSHDIVFSTTRPDQKSGEKKE